MTTSFEDKLRLELHQVAGATHIPATPTDNVARSRSRLREHRLGLALAASGAALIVAVPVTAAASGFNIGDAFGWSHDTPLAARDDQTRLLLQLTSADKHLNLLRAPARGGGTCFSVVDTANPTAQPLVASCSASVPTTLSELGSSTTMRGSDTLIVAPGAASITVTGPAGTRSVPVAEGITYLHLSSMELGAPVTVTSLGPDGTTLQQITVMESRNPGPPSGPANADNSGVPSPP